MLCKNSVYRLRDGKTNKNGRCLNIKECTGEKINTYECPGSNNVKLCVIQSNPTPLPRPTPTPTPRSTNNQERVATEVYNFFKGKGWTKNAICGLLGNMERESKLNPDIHQIGGGGGYGLVQWTPGSKLKNWANARGLDYTLTRTQCLKIQDEYEKGEQYYKTKECPLAFYQYSRSNSSPEYLAECFLRNYEKAGVAALNERKTNARKWFNYF